MPPRRNKRQDAYDFTREGCFGVFEVADRPPLYFVQTVFRVGEIENKLLTARAVLKDNLSFDQMIQREINQKHVDGIKKYLREDSLVFFSPLLVALVQKKPTLGLADAYPPLHAKDVPSESSNEESPLSTLILTWGESFECRLEVAEPGYAGQRIEIKLPDGKSWEILPYACTLRLSTNNTSLVVVDGQHRLVALQQLAQTAAGAAILAPLSIPVCIFFPPMVTEEAAPGVRSVPDILRKVFVDINDKAHRVSGHFRVLLRDGDLAATCVREVCELFQKSKMLWLVEWNRHEDRHAFQLESSGFSLTGVGVLHNALVKSGISKAKLARLFPRLLDLEKVEKELDDAAEQHAVDGITSWTNFDYPQEDILRGQICETLAPAVFKLLAETRPLSGLANIVTTCIEARLSDVGDQILMEARDALLASSEPHTIEAKAHIQAIRAAVNEAVRSDESFNYSLYRTQRFQQGLLMGFFEFAHACLVTHELPGNAMDVAVTFSKYLDEIAFGSGDDLFAQVTAPWLEGVVTDGVGVRIITKKRTTGHVARLLLAPLGAERKAEIVATWATEGARDAAGRLSKTLQLIARKGIALYWRAYVKESIHRARINVPSLTGVPEETRDRLVSLHEIASGRRKKKGKPADKAEEELRTGLEEILQPTWDNARRRLERVLGYKIIQSEVENSDDE